MNMQGPRRCPKITPNLNVMEFFRRATESLNQCEEKVKLPIIAQPYGQSESSSTSDGIHRSAEKKQQGLAHYERNVSE